MHIDLRKFPYDQKITPILVGDNVINTQLFKMTNVLPTPISKKNYSYINGVLIL
jgi:hypothetical protein